GHGHEDVRRRGVGEGGLRPVRAAVRRRRGDQRRAREEAGAGQHRSLRRGLDDRGPAGRPERGRGADERQRLRAAHRGRGALRTGAGTRYIANTPAQQREMLGVMGADSIEQLLIRIPARARLSRPLAVPAAMAETDLVRHLRALAGQNANADDYACFLGGGSYDHAIPSPINHLISRGEFFTAYTPYQPEASQGTLRSIFEYQTMMAELTGMDVANASLYDGASSLAEAALMAHSVTGRDGIVLSRGVNPLYRQVVETYGEGPALRITSASLGDGATDPDALRRAVSETTAAVVVQHPNFFGCLEDVRGASGIAHAAGALVIVVA